MDFLITSHHPEKNFVLSGQLTYADHTKFKTIIDALNDDQVRSVALDFSAVDFIDSAGLGMLLLLRDRCMERNLPVSIHAPTGQVEKIFMLSKFDQLFTLRAKG